MQNMTKSCRKIILNKAYTILEFFTQINITEYLKNSKCQKEVKKYIMSF